MTATALVIIACLILYRSGVVRGFLKLFRVTTEPKPETPPTAPKDDRTQWEADASYILASQGLNPDTVPLMGDELLKRIIRDYLDI